MKDQAIKEKMTLTDLMTETSYMKQKKLQKVAVEELKINMKIERTNWNSLETLETLWICLYIIW